MLMIPHQSHLLSRAQLLLSSYRYLMHGHCLGHPWRCLRGTACYLATVQPRLMTQIQSTQTTLQRVTRSQGIRRLPLNGSKLTGSGIALKRSILPSQNRITAIKHATSGLPTGQGMSCWGLLLWSSVQMMWHVRRNIIIIIIPHHWMVSLQDISSIRLLWMVMLLIRLLRLLLLLWSPH